MPILYATIILAAIIIGMMFILFLLPAVITIMKMKCYEKVRGTVINKKERKFYNTVDAPVGRFYHYTYEFDYIDKKYKIEDKAHSRKKLNVGDMVDIYIKEGNPDKYIYPDYVYDRYKKILISLVVIVPLIIIPILIFTI